MFVFRNVIVLLIEELFFTEMYAVNYLSGILPSVMEELFLNLIILAAFSKSLRYQITTLFLHASSDFFLLSRP